MDEKEAKVLHSSIIALMDILVEKGICTVEELNAKVAETDKEVDEAFKENRTIK